MSSINTSQLIHAEMDSIDRRYNPENDAGSVTWWAQKILHMIRLLLNLVVSMEERITKLEHSN